MSVHEASIQKVKEFLGSCPDDCFKLLENNEIPDQSVVPKNVIGWKTKISHAEQWVDIKFTLTSHFPYRLPRVYYAGQPPIPPFPHLTPSRDNHICTYERHSSFIDISSPIELLFETIDKAAEIITTGLSKNNLFEYDLEFQSYWKISGADQYYLSLLTPTTQQKKIYIIKFEPPISKTISTLVSDDIYGEATKWLNNLSRKFVAASEAIYLPLTKPLRPTYPDNNFQAYNYLETALTEGNLNALNKLISKTKNDVVPIVFSYVSGLHHVFGGMLLTRKKMSGVKKPLCKGFRNSKLTPKIQMKLCFGNYKTRKFLVHRVDRDRLQARVGNVNNLSDAKVTIIGCGSIGSRVALNLALNGVQKITLIDHDSISFENITRHICNVNSVGEYKCKAVEEHIKRRVPQVQIDTVLKDGMEIILNELDSFDDNHLVISATGDKTFNLMLNESGLSVACLYAWTELYGYASHSILVVPESGGCLYCKLDRNLDFTFECLSSQEKQILRREMGCGSVYLPFSSIDSDIAASNTCRLAINYLRGTIRKSTIWTYYGDLDEATKQGYESTANPTKNFELVQKQLIRRLGCKICGKAE